MSLAAHRRGHSTGSMSKERDEDLALFDEMKARERNNFLHPSTDDIEASLRYRIVATVSPPPPKPSDLLGLEPEKNDYDWLLTPPGTPLFTSLEDAPKELHLDAAAIRAATRSRPSRIARGSPSPSRRPASPSANTGNLNRRSSFGNSSPSRPSTRPVTPTSAIRPSTPGRSSTPTNRRTLTPSATFNNNNSSSSSRPSSSSDNTSSTRRTARSSSPSRKPRNNVVHPAMPADFGEPPPNLRTSMPDRPASNTRAASLSPRLGNGLSTFKVDSRRAVSPSLSRSFSSSASSSKGSVISSHNSGIEVNRPRINTDIVGKRPISGHEETSPVKPVTKKPVRMTGSNSFSGTSSHKKPFDNSSTRQMDFRRNSTSGFRPLMSNSHISSFYTRASSSLQHRGTLSVATDSSINSSSVASVHDSDHEEEVMSKPMEIVTTGATKDEGQMIKMALSWKPGDDDEELQAVDKTYDMLLVATPTSSEALYSTDFHDEDVEMEIDCQPSPSVCREYEESVRTLLELVISEAVDLAEDRKAQEAQVTETKAASSFQHARATTDFEHQGKATGDAHRVDRVPEAVKDDEMVEARELQEDVGKSPEVDSRDGQAAENSEACSSSKDSVHCFSQLIDPKYSSSSIEVYQFDQELQTTGSEIDPVVQQNSHSRNSSRDYSTPPSTSGINLDRKTSSSSSVEHPKAEVHVVARTSARASKPTPSFKHFNTHLTRKRESRESSLFSIQINSSKGESISSGRPASTDDTHSSMDDTPRRFQDACNGVSYKTYDEYDTKSEESCVDYYIDSMEPKKYAEVEKTVSKESAASPATSGRSLRSPSPLEILPKDHRHHSFDTDDGYVDYYIDDFSSQNKNRKTISADLAEFVETEKSLNRSQQSPVDIIMESQPLVEDRSMFVEEDDTHIEVCSMDSDSGGQVNTRSTAAVAAATAAAAAIDEEIDTMTECWKQLEEMECDVSVVDDGKSVQDRRNTGAGCEYDRSETRDSILFCSSIVHDIVYRAASLGMEKEDLKALATPASADELVTFLGLSKQMGASFDMDAAAGGGAKWKSEESTVRRTLTYMQNQKLMQNTTVAYMQQSPVGRVEEDVKDHIIPEHHFIDRSLERREDLLRLERKAKAKCRCTIL